MNKIISEVKGAVIFTIFFVVMFVMIWPFFRYFSSDSCLEDNVCEKGRKLEYCWPCGEACEVTEDYCRTYGGFWSGEACKMDRANFNRKICVEAGGQWSEDEQRCDFSAKCPYRRKRGAF